MNHLKNYINNSIKGLLVMTQKNRKKVVVSEDITIKKLTHILNMRDLYLKILNFEGNNLFDELLKPWIKESNYTDFINDVSENIFEDYTILNSVHTEELYALSRVLDTLTLPFQESCTILNVDRWKGHTISLSEYKLFVENIGLDIIEPNEFHPFNCEIFEAKKGQKNFQITKNIFPSVYLKNMLIKRAGVFFTLDDSYDLSYINTTTMYWAYRRNNRDCEDLSHGWGGNSQWRTNHRIDLQSSHGYVYNENGEVSLNVSEERLTLNHKRCGLEDNIAIDDGIDLLKYRQIINSAKDNIDFSLFELKYEETNK